MLLLAHECAAADDQREVRGDCPAQNGIRTIDEYAGRQRGQTDERQHARKANRQPLAIGPVPVDGNYRMDQPADRQQAPEPVDVQAREARRRWREQRHDRRERQEEFEVELARLRLRAGARDSECHEREASEREPVEAVPADWSLAGLIAETDDRESSADESRDEHQL